MYFICYSIKIAFQKEINKIYNVLNFLTICYPYLSSITNDKCNSDNQIIYTRSYFT